MSRFLSNDFINKDPRAKLTVAKMANIGDLVTPSAEYLTASGLTSLTVTAGCVVKHIRATIKAYRSGKITKEKLLMKYASWEGHAKHADTYRLRMKIKGQIEAEIKKKELIGNGSITPDN